MADATVLALLGGPDVEPAAERAAEPAAERAAERAAECAAERAAEPAAERAAECAAEPAAEPAAMFAAVKHAVELAAAEPAAEQTAAEPAPTKPAAAESTALALLTAAPADFPRALMVQEPPERYAGYDPEKEDREYARSLLDPKEKAALSAELAKYGHFQLSEIRALLAKNTGMRHLDDGVFSVDAELLIQIDQRTRDPVFILPDNTVYFRDKLLETYPFELLGSAPEEIFAQQEVGVFEPGDGAPAQYLARDYGCDDEFILTRDLVAGFTRAGHQQRRPARVVRTKIFLARQGWEDFQHIVRDLRAKRRLYANAARRCRETGTHNLLSLRLAGVRRPAAIADTAASDADASAAAALAALLDAL